MTVDAFVGAEGAVVGVVHDVQADAGQAESHDDFRDPEPQPVPVAPNVINPHGTKNAASITAVLRYMRQSPWRDFRFP